MNEISKIEIERNVKFIERVISTLNLSLNGLTVLTECASGPYVYTSIAAAMAGAKVIAYGKDTRYGSFKNNILLADNILQYTNAGIRSKIQFTKENGEIPYNIVDILTNSGMLRPLSAEIINLLKSTCVIPLMWETWEFRNSDLDIIACQKRQIPVIGTNEYFPPTNMELTIGLFGVKILFDMKISVSTGNIVLIGGKIPALQIAELYEKMGVSFVWFSPTGSERNENCYPYSELERITKLKYVDAFVCAEHSNPFLIAGRQGGISFKEIFQYHPTASWGHIVGNIDTEELKESGLRFYPEILMPFGHQTYGTENLGYEPVIQLNMCGLKVGELASKARLKGLSVEETIKITTDYGIGQDFEGGFLQFKPKKS